MQELSDAFSGKAAEGLLVPSVIEKVGPVERAFDIYSKLLRDRIVILDGPVTQESANLIVNQLLYLESENPNKDITLYINSPGGSVTAGMAIYDTMRRIKCDVSTIGLGQNASMGSFLLAAGTKGKRFILPNTQVMTHQPSAGTQGKVSDMKRAMNEFERIKTRMTRLYMHFLGVDRQDCDKLLDRDWFMNALQAKELGHVDEIIAKVPGENAELSEDDKTLFALEMDILQDEMMEDKPLLEIIAHRKAMQGQPQPTVPPALTIN